MKNQFINLDFTSFYVSSAPSAEGDFFFLERELGGFFVVADGTSSSPDCSAAFSGVFDEGFFLVLFFFTVQAELYNCASRTVVYSTLILCC